VKNRLGALVERGKTLDREADLVHRWFAATLVMALLFLAGCVVVPAGPFWYGHPHHHGRHGPHHHGHYW